MSKVIVRNTPWNTANYRTEEAPAAAAVTPGDLIEKTSAGKVQRNSTAADKAPQILVALPSFAGQGIDDDYAATQDVHFVHAGPGWRLRMRLADSMTIDIGDKLVSNGSGGTLKAATSTDDEDGAVVGVAAEAVTTSGAVDRIDVDII